VIRLKSLLLESAGNTVMKYLTGKGLTDKQAAGLAGNLQQESQFKPGADKKIYIVKSGDSLSAIAVKHKTTTDKLKKANGLKTDLIKPGQKLIIK
jgi:LysM repeat protein